MNTSVAIVDVAVGLIVREGQVLLAKRAEHQHQGGRYEFPGGKVEAGEAVETALHRELNEELGISILAPQFIQRLTYPYPEKTVRLHVYRIEQFSGDPVGQEGQPLHWMAVDQLHELTFPDANQPIVRAARLPDRYAITPCWDVAQAEAEGLVEEELSSWLAEQMIMKETDGWVYVRLPGVSAELYALAVQKLAILRPDLRLIAAWDAPDLVNELITGRHLTQSALMTMSELPRLSIQQYWFAGCHDEASICHAAKIGVDAITLGPVLATPTHPEHTGLGWERFTALARQSDLPVYALGGMQGRDLTLAKACGGYGVAGIRFI